MATPTLSDEACVEAIALVQQHGSISGAARASGMPPGTLQRRMERARERPHLWPDGVVAQGLRRGGVARVAERPRDDLESPELPDELPSADELLERRKREFTRKDAAARARQLIPVAVRVDGPIGILHMGDPHVDDPGTDIALIEAHVRLVQQTPGLFAGNVGDYSNNWPARLAHLHAEQSTTAREAWVLVEWLVSSLRWAYLVGGNHDHWSGAGDLLQWITRQMGVRYDTFGARLELRFPNGRSVRINARHDFRGHSMWNTAHGPAKAVQMGWRDHILTCGHLHTSGYQVLRDPATGLISHALRVGSYKTHDRYAQEKGLPNQCVFVAPVTIIDPRWTDDDPRLITTIFDPENAASYLTWLRRKAN